MVQRIKKAIRNNHNESLTKFIENIAPTAEKNYSL